MAKSLKNIKEPSLSNDCSQLETSLKAQSVFNEIQSFNKQTFSINYNFLLEFHTSIYPFIYRQKSGQ